MTEFSNIAVFAVLAAGAGIHVVGLAMLILLLRDSRAMAAETTQLTRQVQDWLDAKDETTATGTLPFFASSASTEATPQARQGSPPYPFFDTFGKGRYGKHCGTDGLSGRDRTRRRRSVDR